MMWCGARCFSWRRDEEADEMSLHTAYSIGLIKFNATERSHLGFDALFHSACFCRLHRSSPWPPFAPSLAFVISRPLDSWPLPRERMRTHRGTDHTGLATTPPLPACSWPSQTMGPSQKAASHRLFHPPHRSFCIAPETHLPYTKPQPHLSDHS